MDASVPLDDQQLTGSSRALADYFFERYPELRAMTRMVSSTKPDDCGSFDIQINIPSPTNDPEREIMIWMNDDDPSISFGTPFHTHASLQEKENPHEAIENVMLAIRAGQMVHASFGLNFAKEHGWVERFYLDLSDTDEILDDLTSPAASGRLEIFSWSGLHDCILTVENFLTFQPPKRARHGCIGDLSIPLE